MTNNCKENEDQANICTPSTEKDYSLHPKIRVIWEPCPNYSYFGMEGVLFFSQIIGDLCIHFIREERQNTNIQPPYQNDPRENPNYSYSQS